MGTVLHQGSRLALIEYRFATLEAVESEDFREFKGQVEGLWRLISPPVRAPRFGWRRMCGSCGSGSKGDREGWPG